MNGYEAKFYSERTQRQIDSDLARATADIVQASQPVSKAIDSFNAVGICEGFIEADSQEEVIAAWQHLIDTGLVWQLQGFFGRQAARLIDEGVCRPAQKVAS